MRVRVANENPQAYMVSRASALRPLNGTLPGIVHAEDARQGESGEGDARVQAGESQEFERGQSDE